MLKQKLINIETSNNINFHLFFLFLLSLNYLFPLIIFGNITLFYNDALDSEIVYNSVLGKVFNDGQEQISIFLNGEININHLRRAFQPLTIIYAILNTELAYWVTDIIVKITSYLSFFILAKKIHKKIFVCCLVACFYASINLPTLSGLGTAIFPYIIYLLIFKTELKLKNYIIVFLFGLNSDFITTIISIPFLILLSIAICPFQKKIYYYKYLKIFFIFCFAILISNSNLILLSLSSEVVHRVEFMDSSLPIISIFKNFLISLIKIPLSFDWTLAALLPLSIILPFLFLVCFFFQSKEVWYIFIIIILLQLFIVLLKIELFVNFYNNPKGLLGTLNPEYAKTIFPLLYSLLSLIILKNNNFLIKNIFKSLLILSILLSQINSSIVPIYKKFYIKEANYRNIYTFKGYYLYQDYEKIKKIVKNQRTMSVGLDPMVSVMNGIYVVDGYHSIYPLKYKKQFRKIIKDELDENLETKRYYDNWGSRVYAFVNDPKSIKINFREAKDIGANFVISKYELKDKKLSLVCKDCSKYFKLYFINQ